MRVSVMESGMRRTGLRTAIVLGLAGFALAGCGSDGRGAAVEKCKPGDATSIEVTYQGSSDYAEATDPAVLVNFNMSTGNAQHRVSDPENSGFDFLGTDYADKIGEIACSTGNKTFLNTTGSKIQGLYLAKQKPEK